MTLTPIDVPAWLGLKALALAWPRTALAFEILEPGCGPKPGQSCGLAWPGNSFWKENKNNLHMYTSHKLIVLLVGPDGLDISALPATSQMCHTHQLMCTVHCEVIGLWPHGSQLQTRKWGLTKVMTLLLLSAHAHDASMAMMTPVSCVVLGVTIHETGWGLL